MKFAEYTLEYELICASEYNWRLIVGIYKQLHPKTKFLANTFSLHERALHFLEKLESNKDKSELAEILAQKLDGRFGKSKFKVPDYIETGIEDLLRV